MNWGYTTSSAEAASRFGPTAHERRRVYEEKHPDRYFVRPDNSASKEWECWEQRTEADDVLIRKHTGLTHLLKLLEEEDAHETRSGSPGDRTGSRHPS